MVGEPSQVTGGGNLFGNTKDLTFSCHRVNTREVDRRREVVNLATSRAGQLGNTSKGHCGTLNGDVSSCRELGNSLGKPGEVIVSDTQLGTKASHSRDVIV